MHERSTPLLPARSGYLPSDRRTGSRTSPWHVVVVNCAFLAANEASGRSYRLAVSTRAEADAQVALLNDASLEISA